MASRIIDTILSQWWQCTVNNKQTRVEKAIVRNPGFEKGTKVERYKGTKVIVSAR